MRPEACFVVCDGYPLVECSQRSRHRRGRVTLQHHPIGRHGDNNLLDSREGSGGERRKPLIRRHKCEIDIRTHVEQLEDRLDHFSVLASHAHVGGHVGVTAQFRDDRCKLDRLWPGTKHHQKSHASNLPRVHRRRSWTSFASVCLTVCASVAHSNPETSANSAGSWSDVMIAEAKRSGSGGDKRTFGNARRRSSSRSVATTGRRAAVYSSTLSGHAASKYALESPGYKPRSVAAK